MTDIGVLLLNKSFILGSLGSQYLKGVPLTAFILIAGLENITFIS